MCHSLEPAIRDLLPHLESNTNEDYNEIKIAIGTKDCQSVSDTVEPQIDSMKEVLQKAKVLTDNVQISSVIPRLDQNNKKVDLLNVGLLSLYEQAGVKYIDNRPGFRTQDGEVNDGYLANDGILKIENIFIQGSSVQIRYMYTHIKIWSNMRP